MHHANFSDAQAPRRPTSIGTSASSWSLASQHLVRAVRASFPGAACVVAIAVAGCHSGPSPKTAAELRDLQAAVKVRDDQIAKLEQTVQEQAQQIEDLKIELEAAGWKAKTRESATTPLPPAAPVTEETAGSDALGAFWKSKPSGGQGGEPFSLECSKGRVVTGVLGRSGAVLDAVSLECRQIVDGEVEKEPGKLLSYAGGFGGDDAEVYCPEGQVATKLGGSAGSVVDQIAITCQSFSSGATGETSVTPGTIGGTGGVPFLQSCPEGHVLTGVHGSAGKVVDRIGAVCRPSSEL